MAHSATASQATATPKAVAHTSSIAQASAVRALQLEMKQLREEPVEGFRVNLADDANLFEWEVGIFGSPGTIYEGGYFKARIKFPTDYPYSPPTVKFLCKMWHPNVYENGEVCISILHPPVDDPLSGELASERWNPTQNVRTILLSIISLMNEPNTSSPANVDASVAYRKWKDSKGKDNLYETVVRKQVLDTKAEAEKDGISVPKTLQEYCISAKPQPDQQLNVDIDFYDDNSVDDSDNEAVACSADFRTGEACRNSVGS